tara:strand:+ start:48 stop:587 length:540 start_codon:yes stop_codon:yes gene_type:complete
MQKFKKNFIGILGGSFDPPHKGHLEISKISLKKLNLNKLIWSITKKNPFKEKALFSLKKRINKCKAIILNNKKIKIRYLEKKTKSSRTIDILKYLIKKNNKNTEFFLIIGSDNLITFHKWKNYKKITSLCKIVVFSRSNFDKKAFSAIRLNNLNKKQIIHIKNKKIDISSSKLRKIYLR